MVVEIHRQANDWQLGSHAIITPGTAISVVSRSTNEHGPCVSRSVWVGSSETWRASTPTRVNQHDSGCCKRSQAHGQACHRPAVLHVLPSPSGGLLGGAARRRPQAKQASRASKHSKPASSFSLIVDALELSRETASPPAPVSEVDNTRHRPSTPPACTSRDSGNQPSCCLGL